MKGFIYFARALTWLFFIFPLLAIAQKTTHVYPNYVVIGAFAHLDNAINFTDDAKYNQFPAQFEMNPNRNLYYVYVLTTADRELAIAEAVKLRADTKYFDTWVYSGGFGKDALTDSENASTQDFDPVTGKKMELVTSDHDEKISGDADVLFGKDNPDQVQRPDPSSGNSERSAEEERAIVRTEAARLVPKAGTTRSATKNTVTTDQGVRPAESAVVDSRVDDQTRMKETSDLPQQQTRDVDGGVSSPAIRKEGRRVTSAASRAEREEVGEQVNAFVDASSEKNTSTPQILPPKKVTSDPLQAEEVEGKNFYFYIFRGDNGNTVEGEVEAIDFEKSWKMATYPGNESVTVRPPSGKSKRISFLCQVFGYRKQQKEYDPANPSEDLYLDDKGNLVVPFELMRLQKGDIAIMYNVFFFKDAAVMRPESRYEINNLLELLKENPSYNIRIHGHTNGNASGKIIRMDMPGNFYSLSGTTQGFGSAKKLSEERAIVIKEFLLSSGISEGRMEIKAWGGKKPIHDKHSVRAKENVRVEIEILSE